MGPGALALLGRALEALLDETHFLWVVFVLDAQRWRRAVSTRWQLCKSVSDALAAVLATGVGGERTRRRPREWMPEIIGAIWN